MADKTKILIGCPILSLRFEWLLSFIKLWDEERLKQDRSLGLLLPYRKSIHIADNMLIETAVKDNYDYLLRMDDDIWDIPKGALDKLLEADKDLISAVMYAGGFPYQKCVMIKKDKTESLVKTDKEHTGNLDEAYGKGIIPVDLTAFPFTLFKVSLFKEMPNPYYDGSCTGDTQFCQKMLDIEKQPYVHMDIEVTHNGVTGWNRLHFLAAELEHRVATNKIDKDNPLYKLWDKNRLHKTNEELTDAKSIS